MDARLSPEGFVAQRFPQDFNGHGHWIVTSCSDETQLQVTVKSDDEVADWPVLVVANAD